MAFLICTFASPRSREEKIHEWLQYLDDLERLHGNHPDRLHTIHTLRARATGWLNERGRQEHTPASIPASQTEAVIAAEPPSF